MDPDLDSQNGTFRENLEISLQVAGTFLNVAERSEHFPVIRKNSWRIALSQERLLPGLQ